MSDGVKPGLVADNVQRLHCLERTVAGERASGVAGVLRARGEESRRSMRKVRDELIFEEFVAQRAVLGEG